MDFAIGDGVMYPSRGAGTITGVEELELAHGLEQYYVIEIPGARTTMRVPKRKIDDLGVRLVMSQDRTASVLEILSDTPHELANDYKVRQSALEDDIKKGAVVLMAAVVRDLTGRERNVTLTKKDTDLLGQARDLLAAEMAMSMHSAVSDAHGKIDAALASSVTK